MDFMEPKSAEQHTRFWKKIKFPHVKSHISQPPQIEKSPSSAENRPPSIVETYAQLLKAESAQPGPDELISISLHLNPSELETLTAAGIDATSGRVKRADLLRAGFVFNNRIGDGEKPLFNVILQGVDYGSRTLLTQAELDAIREYQNAHPDEYQLPSGVDLEDVRRDMVSLLVTSTEEPVFTRYHQMGGQLPRKFDKNEFTNPIPVMRDPKVAEIISEYRAHLREEYEKAHPEITNYHLITGGYEKQFIQEKCADVYVPDESYDGLNPTLRGMRAHIFPIRRGKVRAAPSPFLDSGFHFGQNPDVFLIMPDDKTGMRVNMVSLHLLSRGLSEMGDSKGGSYDQHYATAREYYDNIFPKDPQKRKKLWEEEERKNAQTEDREEISATIQQRFINEAYAWKNAARTS